MLLFLQLRWTFELCRTDGWNNTNFVINQRKEKGRSVKGLREPQEEEDERRRACLKEAEKTGTLTGRDPTLAIGSMILLC